MTTGATATRVLLVEDDDDHAELAMASLARGGRFEVERVASGAEALARAPEAPYAALVVDYRLGDMDGLSVLAQLRAAGTTTPVLLLTSQGSERLAAEAVRARADDYLSKESGLVGDGLGRAVVAMLERRRLADALARARDEFLAAASHDLKNPLIGIKLTAELLQRRIARAGGDGAGAGHALPTAQVVAGLGAIQEASARLLAQIDELLDVARLQVGRPLDLTWRPTELVGLARRVATVYQHTTERHTIQVESHQPELVGWWDEARLERVVGNLLSNAIKYSPDGGSITLTITTEPGDDQADQLPGSQADQAPGYQTGQAPGSQAGPAPGYPADQADQAGQAAGWARLAVHDAGIGIPASELPHVLELFQRAEAVRGQIPGTGIGLAAVRQIIEQHGGSVSIASQERVGTTVTVRLPLQWRGPAAVTRGD